jgi:hypothetical protein
LCLRPAAAGPSRTMLHSGPPIQAAEQSGKDIPRMLAHKALRTAAAVRTAVAGSAAAAVSIEAAVRTAEISHPASLVVGEGALAAHSRITRETKNTVPSHV